MDPMNLWVELAENVEYCIARTYANRTPALCVETIGEHTAIAQCQGPFMGFQDIDATTTANYACQDPPNHPNVDIYGIHGVSGLW